MELKQFKPLNTELVSGFLYSNTCNNYAMSGLDKRFTYSKSILKFKPYTSL